MDKLAYNNFMAKLAAHQEKLALSNDTKSWYAGQVARRIPSATEDFIGSVKQQGVVKAVTDRNNAKDIRRVANGVDTFMSNPTSKKWMLKGILGMKSPLKLN